MRNNNNHLKYNPSNYWLSHAKSIATTVDRCTGTRASSGHGLGMLIPTVHEEVGFLATHLSFNISATVRFGLEEQAESLTYIIEHLKNQCNYTTRMSHLPNKLNMTIGITERSERYNLLNRLVHVDHLLIKEMEEGI